MSGNDARSPVNAVIDTDIGSDIDDTMALLLCLHLPRLVLKALTTVYGQVNLRAKIARKLLDLAGVDVPVAVGEGTPISSPMKVWHAGIEGQGILDEDEMRAPPSACGALPDAVDLLVGTAAEFKQKLDVIAIGPLTNLARAIQRDPEFRANVRRIWAMIGGVTYPDRPPDRALAPGESFVARASHNVRCDVGAARIVLESGIPVVMVGNDVTTRCRIDLSGIARIEKRESEFHQAVVRMMRTWLQYRSEVFGRPVTWTCLHDALVVAEAYGMGFTQRDPVDVEISDDAGTTVFANPDSHIEVSRTVDHSAFERWYLDTVATGTQHPQS